ncbi:MAG: hypothetical protein Tsb002_07860 [Wenzhouxiangellaceae bacterium]
MTISPLRQCLLLVALLLVSAAATAAIDPALLAGMQARAIGPSGMSGRVAAVAAVSDNPNIIYAGAASGGLWKSVDGGLSFEPIFDDQPVHAIGAIAIDPQNPQVIWVGTGEGNVRNSVSIGGGIFRSSDGGRSWQRMGLEQSERIHRIIVHPQDSATVYVTALGALWGENEERGVYRTRDNGKSWEKILYIDEQTGASDLTMDPQNPNKLFASTWQFRRWPYHFKSGGQGSALWRSVDGGDSWQRLSAMDGLPKGELGRIGVAIAPSDPNIVYALVEAEKSAFLRSTDGGYSFETMNTDASVAERPFYYNSVYVDPQNPNRVYRTASLVHMSIDGGKTFTPWITWNKAHPDHHSLWIHPEDGRYAITGNDGGVSITTDHGDTWRHVRNLPIAQFYHVRVDDDLPYNIYGGLQDNGSWRGPSASWENGGIRNAHWLEVAFGDGFDTIPDPDNSRRGYAMSQQGFLYRWNLDTAEGTAIRPPPPSADAELRFNWNAGFAQDPFDSATIYYGSQFVHRSTDRGDTWSVISPDLTSNNPEWQKQAESGGLTLDVTGAENFTTIITIAPSKQERGVLWVGSDDGRIHITRDGGDEWTRIDQRARGVPDGTWVPHITPSPHTAGSAFVVFDNHRRSDFTPYLYRVDDYGQSWTRLDSDGVQGYALILQQDIANPDLLFLGTELGLYISLTGGDDWMRWRHGVPAASVMDLAIQEREHDLVLGTHGRSILVLDDIRPLRQLADLDPETPLRILSAPAAQQYHVAQSRGARFPGATEYRGEDDHYGALITWYMGSDELPHPDDEVERQRRADKAKARKEQPAADDADGKAAAAKPGDKVTMEIRSSDDQLVRRLEVDAKQGLNRTVWDLRREPFRSPRSQPSFFGPGGGPEVPPGKYTITLEWGDHMDQTQVMVRADPRIRFDEQAIAKREAAIERVGDLQNAVTDTIRDLQGLEADLQHIKTLAQRNIERRKERQPGLEIDDDDEHQKLVKALGDSLKRLDEQERELWQPPDTKGIPARTALYNQVTQANWFTTGEFRAPTPSQLAYLAAAEIKAEAMIKQANQVILEEQEGIRELAEAIDLDLFSERDYVQYRAPQEAQAAF